MKLYSYYRSSAAYRVRIALNLKQIPHEIVPISLIKEGGEQLKPEFVALNTNATVPVLECDDGALLTQSLSIIEYLDAIHPDPALLPSEALDCARVRAAAQLIACDIHPLNNLRVVKHIKSQFNASEQDGIDWMQYWMGRGLQAFQDLIDQETTFCFGHQPTLADLCLVPQMYNARRWGLDLGDLQRLVDVEQACFALPAFADATPEAQSDAPRA